MTLTTNRPLKAKCGCGTKAYPSRDAAERALERIKARNLRDVMPKRAVQCWMGQWHLEGAKTVDTGPDKNTRALTLERDDWTCAACGNPIVGSDYSLQHRIARGDGGSSDPAINSPANLITLCGNALTKCHGKAESRDREMQRNGFWLEHWQKPAFEPVKHAVHGWVLLREDGGYDPTRPLGGAA
jgi:5-methylcytosine-specific restriction endonuclease McrA